MYILLNICMNTLTIIFFLFLVGVYVSKKNMNNIETKYYNYLLLINFIELIVHISYLLVAQFIPEQVGLFSIIFKTHLTLVLYYIFFFTVYIICISNSANPEFNKSLVTNKKKYRIIKYVLLILMLLSQFVPKLYVNYDNGGVVSSGLCVIPWYSFIVFYIVICIVSINKNRETIDKKKIIPFYILAVLSVVAIFLSFILPALCIIIVLITLISYLMYHTIENPDLKLINQLELAKNQAEKSNEAKTDFLSSMSHEIRTPLNAIMGLSQMIAEGNDMETMKSDSRDILVASQNLLEIVNGILDINQLEANKVDIDNSDYQTIQVIEDVLKMIRIRIGEKPIDLKVKYQENIPELLHGDSAKLKQILTNLLTNAVKYTEKGFIYFNVNYEIERDKCILIISVRDTGRGIKEEQIEKLFTKFNRLEKDKDSDIEGTGLGLAITKSLVELLNGKIEVESIFEEGSTFKVTIPQKIVQMKSKEEII